MAGKRMIDESICADKRLNSISEGAENLFYRLLTKTDDAGNVFAEPDLIKGQIYPRRTEISIDEIKKRLLELHNIRNDNELGLLVLYKYNGEFYAHFPNFKKYQKLREDIKAKVSFPLRTCNDPLRTCNDPFTQVSKISKQVSKEVSNDYLSSENLKTLKKLFKDKDSIRRHLTNMNFEENQIEEALKSL